MQLAIDGAKKMHQPVREAVNDRGLFTVGWFGVREKYCSRLKFTIVYEQTNRLQSCSHHPCHLYLLISLSPCTRPSSQPSGASEVSYPFPLLFSVTCQLLNLFF